MRYAQLLGASALLWTLLPAASLAQNLGQNPVFAQPYQYADPDGTGTLTITPLSDASTRHTFQPIQVSLVQGSRRFNGAGVYHSFSEDGAADLPPYTLVAFTLVSSAGRSYFFQGRIAPVNGYTGEGTYFPTDSPQSTVQWRIQSSTTPTPEAIVNSSPSLVQGWSRISFTEAVGGIYYSTYNTFQGAVSTATWSGSLPADGQYNVEVFVPRQPSTNSVPRTSHAVYQIFEAGIAASVLKPLSQQVSTSQWMPLGTFNFRGTYRVVLTDETGESRATRSVVANAIRLTPVSSGGGGGL